jgi:hypothetical protein
MFCWVRFKVLMQGFLHFLWGNFCPESNSSAPTAFSLKRNPASSGQHRVENKTTWLFVPYFEDYVNTVVNVHIGNTEIEAKKHMDISNQEKQQGESFSAFFTRTSFRTNQTSQKTLCFNSLATLFLSCLHQPECVPYTARTCTAILCNSLCETFAA